MKSKQAHTLPFKWKKRRPFFFVLERIKLLLILIISGWVSFSFVFQDSINTVSIIVFLFIWFFIYGGLQLILTFLLYSVDPLIPDLPEGSGESILTIVRSSTGETYIQGFGGREHHQLKSSDNLPFEFKISMISIRFGQNLEPIGKAYVDFKQVGWARLGMPWFKSFRTQLSLGVKWPQYKYIVKRTHIDNTF